MPPLTRALILAALTLPPAACRRRALTAHRTAVAATPTATDPCERVAAAQRVLLEAVPPPPDDAMLPTELTRCIPTPRGAWSLEFDSIHWDTASSSWRGHWSLAHYDAAHRRVAVALTQPGDRRAEDLTPAAENLEVSSPYSSLVSETEAFDYDGDGELELALVLALARHEAEDPIRGRIWTFRDGAIDLFAPTRDIDMARVEDVDHDGRPDLLVTAPFNTTAEAEGSGFTYAIDGPAWVFHSVAGGAFSSNDAVAVGAARTACPSAPGRTLRTPTEVACARAWSLPTAAVQAAITRGCRRRAPVADTGDPCPELDAMRAFAPLDAPTQLGPAAVPTP